MILSSLTPNDDSTATAVIQGVPSGALAFLASSFPEARDQLSVPYSGAGPYTLDLPVPDLWWVWAQDSAGVSGPLPVWTSVAARWINDLGGWLRDTIDTNSLLINKVLQARFPGSSLQRVFYGYPGQTDASPRVVIDQPRFSEEWGGNAGPGDIYGAGEKLITYFARIHCGVLHNTEVTELPQAMRLGGAVLRILARPLYNDFLLPSKDRPSGLRIFNASVGQGSGQTIALEDGRYSSEVELSWSGQAQVNLRR